MKFRTLCLAAALASCGAPALAHAQTNASVTRADAKAGLIRLKQSTYEPVAMDARSPRPLQAAEARAQAVVNAPDLSAFGGAAQGSSASGGRDSQAYSRALYFGQ